MLKLASSGYKKFNFEEEFSPREIIYGANRSGKSSRLEALEFALTGRIAALGARPSDLLSASPHGQVNVTLKSDKFSIFRRVAEEKKFVHEVSLNEEKSEIKETEQKINNYVALAHINIKSTLFTGTKEERKNYLCSLIPVINIDKESIQHFIKRSVTQSQIEISPEIWKIVENEFEHVVAPHALIVFNLLHELKTNISSINKKINSLPTGKFNCQKCGSENDIGDEASRLEAKVEQLKVLESAVMKIRDRVLLENLAYFDQYTKFINDVLGLPCSMIVEDGSPDLVLKNNGVIIPSGSVSNSEDMVIKTVFEAYRLSIAPQPYRILLLDEEGVSDYTMGELLKAISPLQINYIIVTRVKNEYNKQYVGYTTKVING